MADNNNNVPTYPAMFDPSQMSNQFSNFNGSAIPWPTSYVGAPTDSMGNPIKSYMPPPQPVPGTTINSAPNNNLAQWQAVQQANMNGIGGITSQMAAAGIADQKQANAIRVAMNSGMFPQQPQPQPSTPSNSSAYLSALANPGKVTTPGSSVAPIPYNPNQSSDVFNTILAQLKGQAPAAAPAGIGGGSSGISTGANNFLNLLSGIQAMQAQPAPVAAPAPASAVTAAPIAPAPANAGATAPYIHGAAATGATPTDFVPNQFSPQTIALLQAAGLYPQGAGGAAPVPSAGGLGGLGGIPVQRGVGGPPAWQVPQQNFNGIGSGNGGAAGNGSAGGQ